MSRLKAFFRKPVVFGAICFALGAYSYWSVERLLSNIHFNAHYSVTRNSGTPPFADNGETFDDQGRDPFQEMEQMQRQMMKNFARIPTAGGAASSGEMNVREDEKYVYYDIDTGSATPTNFNVKVENGQVTVSGTVEEKSDAAAVSSSFERTFPAPPNTDTRKVEFDNQSGKIILKFPKKA